MCGWRVNMDIRPIADLRAYRYGDAMSKRPIPVAGAIVTAVLVLLFANPPFVDWIRDPKNVDHNSALGFVLDKLTWPAWYFTPGGAGGNMTKFIAGELRAVLIIAMVFAILSMLAKGIGSAGVGFVVGWVATILGAGIAAFIVYFIYNLGGNSSAVAAIADGGTYGLFVGWIVGIGTAIAKR
jgi:hypothetical protein